MKAEVRESRALAPAGVGQPRGHLGGSWHREGGAEATLTKVQLSSADGRAWRVLIQQADKDSHHSGEEKRVFFLLHFLEQTWVLRCLGASRFSQAEGSNLPSGPL